jgi:26S proteasome regulatory subunit N4
LSSPPPSCIKSISSSILTLSIYFDKHCSEFDRISSTLTRDRVLPGAGLQNDYKLLMKRIEYGIYKVHEAAREAGTVGGGESGSASSSSVSSPSASSAASEDPFLSKKPFSRVHSVAAGSPAEQSGLQVGDLILQFGSASFDSSAAPMAGVKDVVVNSENRPVEVVVRRDVQIVRLTLVPKKWSGQGLLGCHILPA